MYFLYFAKIFKFHQCIFLFHNYLPLEKGVTLHFNRLEPPSPKEALCQGWLKLAQWFWRNIFLNFVNVFSRFHNYLPLKKGVAVYFNNSEPPSSKATLCQVWLKLAHWFLRRWKCEKFADRRADDGQQTFRKAHFSFQLRWAKRTFHLLLFNNY